MSGKAQAETHALQRVVAAASLVFAMVAALECHSVVTATAPDAPWLPSALYGLTLWGWWGCIASAIWTVAEKRSAHFFSLRSGLVQILIGSAVAAAHMWALQRTVELLVRWWPVLGPAGYGSLQYFTWNRFFFELLIYGFVFGLIGVVHLKVVSQREAMRALSLEKQLSVAHLRALQMQIEPHFLFNTLNAIASLVELDRKDQAIQTLERLNAILQRTLRESTPTKIKLAQELELTEDYLAIEQTRFADRLHVDMAIDPSALGGLVPCFLLQPLIENAIRHGVSRSEEGGTIQVTVARTGARLQLVVRDNCAGVNGHATNGHGIGLKNTQERLSHLYGGQFDFRAGALEAGGFEVSVGLPYERGGA